MLLKSPQGCDTVAWKGKALPEQKMDPKVTRNIGIIAHIDAGKTTTTERILYYTGENHRIGEVDSGQATMDFLKQEQDRGITIQSAATTCFWRGHQINIIDTPGHVDFTAEVERSLRVLDGAVGIFCAVGGVEPQSETVWKQADEYHVPRIAYINKMDRLGADFYRVLDEIRTKLAVNPVPLFIPVGSESNFCGVIDLLENKMLTFDPSNQGQDIITGPVPADMEDTARQWYDKLIDQVSTMDDSIMELYFAGESIDPALVRSALRKGTLSGNLLPVFVGSSLRNIGVQCVLDGVVDYLPSPDEVPPITAALVKKEGTTTLPNDKKGPLAGLIFKVTYEKETGPLCFVRIYSGTLKKGEAVMNVGKKKRERVNRILRMHADRSEDLSVLEAGDIGVIVGFKLGQTGDTIALEGFQVALEEMSFPNPVITVAIEPKTMSDHDKLAGALQILSWEDPTFTWKENEETGQIVISGMGELHLDVLTTRLIEDMKVDVRVGNPQVSYRESILSENEETFVFSKVIAQKENTATVTLKVTPLGPKGGLVYENKVSLKAMPREMFDAVERGVRSAMQGGIRFGYEVCDMKVELTGVKYSELLSSEFAFEAAGAQCFDKACNGAGAVIMEPVMDVIVSVPSQYVGEVISSLTMRGGLVSSMESRSNGDIIHAQAPLAKLFGYSTALRSSTQGRGTFSMSFDHYAPSDRQS